LLENTGAEVTGFTSSQLKDAAILPKVGSAIKAIVASMKYWACGTNIWLATAITEVYDGDCTFIAFIFLSKK